MRFPFPSTRCDSPAAHPRMGEGTPIIVEVSQRPARGEVMHLERHRHRIPPIHDRHRQSVSRAYRQGYLDASSAALLHTRKPSRSSTAVPSPLVDFASDHPYTTIATIGALGTLTLLSSSYLATGAWRGLMRQPSTMTQGYGMAPRLDDLERRLVGQVQAANRDRRSELENFRRELLGQIAVAQQRGPMIISANTTKIPTPASITTNTTSSSDSVKAEAGFMHNPRTTRASSTPSPPGAGRKPSQSSILAAVPIAPYIDEARLGQVMRGAVEDVLKVSPVRREDDSEASLARIETALEAIGSQVEHIRMCMDDDFEYDDKDGAGVLGGRPGFDFPPDTDAHSIAHALDRTATSLAYHRLPKPEVVEAVTNGDKIDVADSPDQYNSSFGNDRGGVISRAGSLDESTNACIELMVQLQATADRVEGRIDRLEGTMEEMAKGLRVLAMQDSMATKEDVKEEAKDFEDDVEHRGRNGDKNLKVKQAAFEKIAKPKVKDTAITAVGRGGMGTGATGTGVNIGGVPSNVDSVGAESPSASSSAGYSAKHQPVPQASSNPTPSEPKPAPTTPIPPAKRLGVDDSGAWTFHLNPIPTASIPKNGAGWRLATIVHSRSHAERVQGKGFGYSHKHSSSSEHFNQEVFVYPEFDIIRLDGRLWRCARVAGEVWRVKERIEVNNLRG